MPEKSDGETRSVVGDELSGGAESAGYACVSAYSLLPWAVWFGCVLCVSAKLTRFPLGPYLVMAMVISRLRF